MRVLYCLFLLVAIFFSFATLAINAQYSCVRESPIEIQGSINSDDMSQLGRIYRDGQPSSCTGSNATLDNGTIRKRDTHNFVNPYSETVCVRVEVDFTGCGGNQTQSVAYSSFNPLLPANNVIGDMGFSTIGKGSYSFSVGPNASFTIGVNELDPGMGCPLYKLKVTYLRNCRQAGTDITNDGKADLTVYRTSSVSKWYSIDSATDQPVVREFGTVGDIVVGGSDYTGDGKSDLSVYRPSNTTWYYGTDQNNPGANYVAQPWGLSTDRALAGDFDADGKNDIAVFRGSEATFYVLRSSDGSVQTTHWGVTGDIPVVGDFDGDTAVDFAVVRPTSDGLFWWVLQSNYNYGFDTVTQWGLASGDKLVPGDYDGDARTDIAIWRQSTGVFYVRKSTTGLMEAFKWGTDGDKPQPADYDGDLKVDYAVFRPSNGTWYINNSGTQTTKAVKWGLDTDQPITSPYRIQ